MKVLNFGSLNLDYVYQVESILIPGETQASRNRQTFCGGKGLNRLLLRRQEFRFIMPE